MKRYIIDTNALISFVTDKSPEQQAHIAEMFENAARLNLLVVCHQNVLTKFVYVMDTVYHVSARQIKKIIKDFISMPGIEIVHEIKMDTLLSFWPDRFQDYGDAILAALCKDTKGSSLATFDRKFVKVAKKLGLSVHFFDNP